MLKIILLSIAGIYLYHDYKRDKGLHIKAKIINGLVIGLVTFLYADYFRYVIWMIRKPDKVKEMWNTPVGIIPGELHLFINILSVFAGISLIIFASQLTKRSLNGRVWTLRLMPILTAVEIFSFYRGWISDGNDSMADQILALVTGTILVGGICILIIRTYKTEFMNDFFSRKNLNSIENK
jgi:hypothetical protein